MRLLFVIVSLGVVWPSFGVAHLEDETLPDGADQIIVPEIIPLLDFVRYTRLDHRLLLYRLARGDRHVVAGLTQPLNRAAAYAGEINPRPTASLIWDMAQLSARAARERYLADELTYLTEVLAAMEANPETEQIDLDTVDALIALIRLWQMDPMAGVNPE